MATTKISSNQIADNAITAAKLPTGSVTDIKIAAGVDAAKIGDGSVSNAEFQRLDGVTSAIQTQIDSKTPTARTISTTSPITGGGDLSANRTIAIPAATTLVNGYLASADFTTFNNKVSSTRTITAGSGLTGGGDLSADRTLDVNVDGSTLEVVADTVRIKDLGVTSAKLATAIDAVKIADGSVTNAEFQRLDGVTSAIQTQIDSKQATGNYITALTGDIAASGPGSAAATLPTVNANVGTFISATVTVDAKGRITAASAGSSGGEISLSRNAPTADFTVLAGYSAVINRRMSITSTPKILLGSGSRLRIL